MAVPAKQARGTANRGVPIKASPLINPFPEQDYIDVLVGCLRKVLALRNTSVQKKALAQLNAKIAKHSLPVLPPSHEWSGTSNRLLYFRYYVEGLVQLGGGGISEDELIISIAQQEIQYELKNNAHYRAYQDLTESLYGRKFRPPNPPAPEKPPELDPETRETIERNQVNQKLQLYAQSLSKGKAQSDKAYADLLLAYIETVSDLAVPLMLEFQDQQERAENHPWIEWMQANDFPWQHEKLFPVLYGLLQQAREAVKAKDLDHALDRLTLAQNLYDRLAELMYNYYTGKVRKGSRVVIALSVLKSISRMLVSLVVFKNVKGVVSQFAALIAVNLVYQQLDKSIGTRSRGLSGTEAVRDAALELLMVKVTGKLSELMVTRFGINPEGVARSAMDMLANTVIGSMEEEFVKLGRGVNFVGFLRNLRDKFTSPEFWVENIAMAVLAKNYSTTKTVSLPGSPRLAQAATVATVLAFMPKAANAEAVNNKPMVIDVAPQNNAAAVRTARTGVQPEIFKSDAAQATAPVEAPKASAQPDAIKASATPDARARGATRPSSVPPAQAAATQEQRSVITSAPARGLAPDGPTRSPALPVGSAGMGGAAAVGGRNPRRGKVLSLFQKTRKLLDKINDPKKKKECEDRLDELRKAYDKANNHAETIDNIQAVKNRINEIYAEEQIDFLLEHNLRSFDVKKVLAKVAVPRRGNAGPEIIDMVYKVIGLDGKVAFLIIESKYGSSRLGWVQYGKRTVRQFSPEWFEMRIEEIRLKGPGFAGFAKDLQACWDKGQILPFVVKIRADGSPKGYSDYKKEWTKYNLSSP